MFNGNDLPHELLLTTRQKTKIRNAFNYNTSTGLKLSRFLRFLRFLSRLLGPLLKTGLPLIKNVIKPLAKSVLIPLGLTAAASAADAGIHKKILGSGNTTLIISNEEMNDFIKIVQALASVLGNLLTGKGIVTAGYGRLLSPASQNNKGKSFVRAAYGDKIKNKMDF